MCKMYQNSVLWFICTYTYTEKKRHQNIWPQGYKTFFMLNLAEHEMYPANNVKMPTSVGILTFISILNTTSERLKARNIFICRYFSFYEQLKFRDQLS